MRAVDMDDQLLNMSRMTRLALARVIEKQKSEQKGEAFVGLEAK